jgi:hypothetical protein
MNDFVHLQKEWRHQLKEKALMYSGLIELIGNGLIFDFFQKNKVWKNLGKYWL